MTFVESKWTNRKETWKMDEANESGKRASLPPDILEMRVYDSRGMEWNALRCLEGGSWERRRRRRAATTRRIGLTRGQKKKPQSAANVRRPRSFARGFGLPVPDCPL